MTVLYFNMDDKEVRSERTTIAEEIDKRGLLYPVTYVDGVPLYDGAVSYPAILRAVHNKLAEGDAPAQAAGA